MASIALGLALGSSIGAAGLGSIGVTAGLALGSYLGNRIDNQLFFKNSNNFFHGNSKLENILVQTSAYGQIIPEIYGYSRLAGNIIWATKVEEHVSHHHHRTRIGKGGGRKVASTEIHYSYTINLAIAIGNGPIDEISKIWADSHLLDLSKINIRIYNGDETQLPDPLIEALDGIGKTPAYRGLAYIVLEQFELTSFGNRIPNFTFEVKKTKHARNFGKPQLEDLLEAVNIIPGCGEFVYDTKIQFKQLQKNINNRYFDTGKAKNINCHNPFQQADSVLSAKQLINTCPNLKWTAVTCSWFANEVNIQNIKIAPRIEYKNITNFPGIWQVGNYTRVNTQEITKDQDNFPLFGGTPSDDSILNYVEHLHAQNLNISFYPLLQIDQIGKPWRGHITGQAEFIPLFFEQYNKFILHYAQLLKGKIQAFIIGSELIGLTKIKNNFNQFITVDQLIILARQVREILGPEVIITYAADWSEYHHTEDGWFNLDPLWADKNIDVIGIDAYFPLTQAENNCNNQADIIAGWTSGEGYEYFYQDESKSQKISLSPQYAWKNLRYFWQHTHFNPDGQQSLWQAKSKPIWFTEFGFPSINKASNQPNKFYDPAAIDGGLPYGSNGSIDFDAQRQALTATLKFIKHNQDMITNAFAWCWDARPFPYFPQLSNVWRDHKLWTTGHWLNGKIGYTSLAAIITDLCNKINITQIDVSLIDQVIEGLIIAEQTTVKQILDALCKSLFFDIFNVNGILTFIPRKHSKVIPINVEDMVFKDQYPLVITRDDPNNLPNEINVIFIDKQFNYQFSVARAMRLENATQHKEIIHLPIIVNYQQAKKIAEINLKLSSLSLTSFKFNLPPKFMNLNLGNLISIQDANQQYIARITKIIQGANYELEIEAIQDDPYLYDFNDNNFLAATHQATELLTQPIIKYGIMPNLNHGLSLYFAAISQTDIFKPVQIFDQSLKLVTEINYEAVLGVIATNLPSVHHLLIDELNVIHVILKSGELEQKDHYQLALINDEIISFKNIELIGENEYLLTQIIRSSNQSHQLNSNFLLLDEAVIEVNYKNLVSSNVYHALYIGQNFSEGIDFTIESLSINLPSPDNLCIIEFKEFYQLSWTAINLYPFPLQDNNFSDPNLLKFWIKIFDIKGALLIKELISSNIYQFCKFNFLIKIEVSSFHPEYGESSALILEL